MRQFILGATLCALAGPGTAQSLNYDPQVTQSCLAGKTTLNSAESCIGLAAATCIDNTPGGGSTIGMGGCYDTELQFWDARLNAAYGPLMAISKNMDATTGNASASLAGTLRAMQRAWISYRDAACDYERAQWGGGTGGNPAMISCLMLLTGKQAMTLEARLADAKLR